jgi:hypothetical protein
VKRDQRNLTFNIVHYKRRETYMRKFAFFVATFATLGFLVCTASAASLTEGQVKNVCGGDLKSYGGAMGCTKKCGEHLCDYGCCKGDKCGDKGCRGQVMQKLSGSGRNTKLPLPAVIRKEMRATRKSGNTR